MDVNTDLAMWSNQLIISAMIVYAFAMIFYAFDLFGARELKTAETRRREHRQGEHRPTDEPEDRVDRGPRPPKR